MNESLCDAVDYAVNRFLLSEDGRFRQLFFRKNYLKPHFRLPDLKQLFEEDRFSKEQIIQELSDSNIKIKDNFNFWGIDSLSRRGLKELNIEQVTIRKELQEMSQNRDLEELETIKLSNYSAIERIRFGLNEKNLELIVLKNESGDCLWDRFSYLYSLAREEGYWSFWNSSLPSAYKIWEKAVVNLIDNDDRATIDSDFEIFIEASQAMTNLKFQKFYIPLLSNYYETILKQIDKLYQQRSDHMVHKSQISAPNDYAHTIGSLDLPAVRLPQLPEKPIERVQRILNKVEISEVKDLDMYFRYGGCSLHDLLFDLRNLVIEKGIAWCRADFNLSYQNIKDVREKNDGAIRWILNNIDGTVLKYNLFDKKVNTISTLFEDYSERTALILKYLPELGEGAKEEFLNQNSLSEVGIKIALESFEILSYITLDKKFFQIVE